jgi:hypothetical protein
LTKLCDLGATLRQTAAAAASARVIHGVLCDRTTSPVASPSARAAAAGEIAEHPRQHVAEVAAGFADVREQRHAAGRDDECTGERPAHAVVADDVTGRERADPCCHREGDRTDSLPLPLCIELLRDLVLLPSSLGVGLMRLSF